MNTSFFNVRQNRWWGLAPLSVLVWHGLYTALYLNPHYLVFVCYTANLLLGIGILIRYPLFIGTGFGWIFIGFPLWLYDAVLNGGWELSGILFHTCGPIVGIMAMRNVRLPRHTWIFAEFVGLVLYGLARLLTDKALNVNAAFRVYQGWEGIFSNYTLYVFIMLVGYGAFFFVLPHISNRFLLVEHVSDENN
ncbi:MAG: hypothetical protein GY801_23520 [bacterium]|nr:hypothetical protein [bacterium]